MPENFNENLNVKQPNESFVPGTESVPNDFKKNALEVLNEPAESVQAPLLTNEMETEKFAIQEPKAEEPVPFEHFSDETEVKEEKLTENLSMEEIEEEEEKKEKAESLLRQAEMEEKKEMGALSREVKPQEANLTQIPDSTDSPLPPNAMEKVSRFHSQEEIPEEIVYGLLSENSAVLARKSEDFRLESSFTSPFLLKLASALENFLDILGEPFEFSPQKSHSETPFTLKRPKTFQGSGFAVTFPFKEKVGVFLIAARGELLPPWFANPGIAGKSRIHFLARELETLFALEWTEIHHSQPDFSLNSTVSKNSGLGSSANAESDSQETGFYASRNFFYGKIGDLEQLFDALPTEKISEFRSFTIRRFDGREGAAWMLGPFSDSEIFHANSTQGILPTASLAEKIKPVRSLESVTIDPVPTPFPAQDFQYKNSAGVLVENEIPKETEILDETQNEVEALEEDETRNEIEALKENETRNEVEASEEDETRNEVEASEEDETQNEVEASKENETQNEIKASEENETQNEVEASKENETQNEVEALKENETQNEVEALEEDETQNEVEALEEGETQNEVETSEEDETNSEAFDFSIFSGKIYRFHFRSKIYSPRLRAMREERILSQIHYAHPAHTQYWRERTASVVERMEAELQTAFLIPVHFSRPMEKVSASQSANPQQNEFSDSALSAGLVETRIPVDAQGVQFDSIQIVDWLSELPAANEVSEKTETFPETLAEIPFVSVTCDSPEDWQEYAFVVGKTLELPSNSSPTEIQNSSSKREILKEEEEEEPFHLSAADGSFSKVRAENLLEGGMPNPMRFDAESLLEGPEAPPTDFSKTDTSVPDGENLLTAESLLETDLRNFQKSAALREKSPFEHDFSEMLNLERQGNQNSPADAESILEIPVKFSILLGRTKLPISELLDWKIGTILNLGQKSDETAEVFVNGGCAGNGFPVEYENRVGVKLENLLR